MDRLQALYLSHPFWAWLAVGAIFLAAEVPTASGYLLWPAGSAAAVALLTLVLPVAPPVQLVVFAALTIASTLIGRRFWPRHQPNEGPDVTDRAVRLPGRFGEATAPFVNGQGRVFVDGAEWIAELESGHAAPEKGARVEVVAVHGGGRLVVRAA